MAFDGLAVTTEPDESTVKPGAGSAWTHKPLTPAQLLINDIRIQTLRRSGGPRLEVTPQAPWSLVPDDEAEDSASWRRKASDAAKNPIQRQQFLTFEAEYGWMRRLRLNHTDSAEDGQPLSTKCRWIHCSSKFEDYLEGFLWALSEDYTTRAELMPSLKSTIEQHARYSKHGKCFTPFSAFLGPSGDDGGVSYPLLMSVPFLDWSVQGPSPPLRFQIDKREGFQSAKSSGHLLRSVLQHFYRLEDTHDRERDQVFNKHKPWGTDRGLDLKLRQWYGHYPTALNVDEMWMLVIDSQHIVTFSSNQTWKSQSPSHQLPSRISDISFRGIRNAFFASEDGGDFTAMTQAIASLNGAVGMMHRSFWPDFLLPLTDRYAGYLSHLQYRLHRAPSTRLVLDLVACLEELGIVISITEQQIETINELLAKIRKYEEDHIEADLTATAEHDVPRLSSVLAPTMEVLDKLQRELIDLRDLRDNTDRLVTRTIQLVNIRLEDHGKAILVFTVVTLIFLPLNFLSSYFGMNFRDIRDTDQTQWLFWPVALCVTAGVAGGSVFLAFSGRQWWERFVMWRDRRKEMYLSLATASQQRMRQS